MKRILCSWLIFLVCINALGSISACITRLSRAINGGAEPGIFPLVGRIMKGLLATNNNGYGAGFGYGPNYAGQYPGSYSTYNQQPLGSTYYPNQALGSTVQTQPMQSSYYSGLPAQSAVLSPQPYPVGTGTSYQPAMATNVQQPFVTPGVQPAVATNVQQPFVTPGVQPAMATNVQQPFVTPGVQPAMVATTPIVQTGVPQRYFRR